MVRGGAGIYYNFLPVFIGFRQMGFSNPPFLLAETFEAAAGPHALADTGAAVPRRRHDLRRIPTITIVEQKIKNSESYQWNLTVERQVAREYRLARFLRGKQDHPPALLQLQHQSRPPVQRSGRFNPDGPINPWPTSSCLKAPAIPRFTNSRSKASSAIRTGVSMQLEYSWNRSLDNTPIVGGPQNPYNTSNDRGNSDQIRRHIFTAAYSYDLPFGRGKRFAQQRWRGGNDRRWMAIGRYYLSAHGHSRSRWVSPILADGWYANRANVTNVGALSRRTLDRPLVRSRPATRFRRSFTFGNSARNLLFGPGDIVFDVSLFKDTAITSGQDAVPRGVLQHAEPRELQQSGGEYLEPGDRRPHHQCGRPASDSDRIEVVVLVDGVGDHRTA